MDHTPFITKLQHLIFDWEQQCDLKQETGIILLIKRQIC